MRSHIGDAALFPEHARLSEPVLLSDEAVPLDAVAHACLVGGGTHHGQGGALVLVGSVLEEEGDVPMVAVASLASLQQLAGNADVGVAAACTAWTSLHWQTLRLPFANCEAWQVELVPLDTASHSVAVLVDTSTGHAMHLALAPTLQLHAIPMPAGLGPSAHVLAAAVDAAGSELAMVTDERQLLVLPLPEACRSAPAGYAAGRVVALSAPPRASATLSHPVDLGDAGATYRLLRSLRGQLTARPLPLAVSRCSHPCDTALLSTEESTALRLLPFDPRGPLADPEPAGEAAAHSPGAASAAAVAFDPPREYIMCNRQHFLRVRSLPSGSAPVIGKVTAGKRVQVLAREGDWLRIAMLPTFAYAEPERLTPTQAWARQFAVDDAGFEHVMLRRANVQRRPEFDAAQTADGLAEPDLVVHAALGAAEVAARLGASRLQSSFTVDLQLPHAASILDLAFEFVMSQTAADLLSRDDVSAPSTFLVLRVTGDQGQEDAAPAVQTLAFEIDTAATEAVGVGCGGGRAWRVFKRRDK